MESGRKVRNEMRTKHDSDMRGPNNLFVGGRFVDISAANVKGKDRTHSNQLR